MLLFASVICSLFIAEYYSIICLYHRLFMHYPIDGHLDCFQSLVIMNKVSKNILVQGFFRHTFSFFSYKYLGVELLNHRIDRYVCLVFDNIAKLFSKVVLPFYAPTNNVQEFWLSHILSNINSFSFHNSSGCGLVPHFLKNF